MLWLLGGYMWLYIHRPFEVWPILGTIRLERVYMILMLAYWACWPGRQWLSNRLNPAYLAFCATILMSWLVSPYHDVGTKTVEDYLKVAVFFVLVMSSVRSEADLRKLFTMYVVIVGFYMLHSLVEYKNGRHMYRMSIPRMVGVDSSYNDPNTFAATILYSLPMAWVYWRETLKKWQRGLLCGYFALSLVCIVLTGSRSGFVGLGVFSGIIAMRSPYRIQIILAMCLAAPIGWNFVPEKMQNRFMTLIDPSVGPKNAQESADSRAEGWRDGVEFWKRRPLLGVGPFAFGEARGYGLQSHHLYGQTIGELGTLGAITFGMILFGFYRNGREMSLLCQLRPEMAGGFTQRVSQAVGMSVVLLLFLGFAGHNLYRYSWMWFGAFQAIALYAARLEAYRIEPVLEDSASAAWMPAGEYAY